MRPKIERLAFGAGLLACLSWACGTVLSKSLLDRFHPLDLLVMQFASDDSSCCLGSELLADGGLSQLVNPYL